MPVSYRVWINGFAADERKELGELFARRTLIAYDEAPSAQQAELLVVDADQPQNFAALRLGRAGAVDAPPVLYIGHTMPSGARWHLPRPLLPGLVQRMLDELVATERPAPYRYLDAFERILDAGLDLAATASLAASYGGVARDPDDPRSGFGPLDALDDLSGDPLARLPDRSLGREGSRRNPAGAANAGPVTSLRTRAPSEDRRSPAHRSRVPARRSRPGRPGARNPAGSAVRALVLEGQASARLETGILLQAFGFRPHTVGSVAEAEHALCTQGFAVAILGDAADGPAEVAGIELCHRIKQGRYTGGPGRPAPKVVMLAQHPRPVDPVRARLAGCDHFVVGPATRGTLALALDAVEVRMPQDPRRTA